MVGMLAETLGELALCIYQWNTVSYLVKWAFKVITQFLWKHDGYAMH